MSKRLMSDAEIKRRKNVQGHISQTTSTLGLASLGMLAASTRTKGAGTYRALKKVPGLKKTTSPAEMQSKLKGAALNTGVVSSGVGGVGGYNFAAYTNAESRKKKPAMTTVKKNYSSDDLMPTFGEVGERAEISKVGEWKSIDQREISQRRSRKAMRVAGAGVGAGAGLVALGHPKGTKEAIKLGGKLRTLGKQPFSAKEKAKGAAALTTHAVKSEGATASTLGGGALVGASAALGGGAKGKHTYDQHKINQRRRDNYRAKVKKDWKPSASKFDPEGQRMKRSDQYEKVIAGAAAGVGATAVPSAVRAGKAHADVRAARKAMSPAGLKAAKGARHAAAVKGGKISAVAGGLAGGAAFAHKKKNSDGWKPYVSKSLTTSAFGIDHQD